MQDKMDRNEIIEKLKSLASETPSNWRKKAEWRVNNREWLRVSGAIALHILIKRNGADARPYVMETLGCNEETAHHILKGDADLRLSEIIKLIGFDGLYETVNGLKKYMDDASEELSTAESE